MNKPGTFTFTPIGVIHSPHEKAEETPIQPSFAEGIEGTVEVFPEFVEGLKDIEGFSHIYLIYPFDRAGEASLLVKPFLQDTVRGVFATRAPRRPNPIGVSLVRLVDREGGILRIQDVDILDATPLLDIKPYSPRFDKRKDVRAGWLDEVDDEVAARRGLRGYREKKKKG